MSGNRFPPRWNDQRVQRLLTHYEQQTEAEAVAEERAVVASLRRPGTPYDAEFERLTADLYRPEWQRCMRACRGLVSLGSTDAAPDIAPLLGHRSVAVRAAAANALGQLGWADAMGAVERIRRGRPTQWAFADLRDMIDRGDLRFVDVMLALIQRPDALGFGGWTKLHWALCRLARHLDMREWLCPPCGTRFGQVAHPSTVDMVWAACTGVARADPILVVTVAALRPVFMLVLGRRLRVCRNCGRAAHGVPGVRHVILVLDSSATDEFTREGNNVRVNWPARERLPDFDSVEIMVASARELERFCIAVGNDPDRRRRDRARELSCRVHPACGLADDAVHMLRSTFGSVVVES